MTSLFIIAIAGGLLLIVGGGGVFISALDDARGWKGFTWAVVGVVLALVGIWGLLS